MHKATVPLIALMCLKLIFSPSFQQSASSSISQTSAGRKTETSSDASQEAPERARKDTPKEANCISRAASLLCVFTSVVSQAFLRRVPSPQGCGYCSSPPCAGNLFYHGGTGIHPCPATVSYYTTKSGLRRKTPHVRIRRRRPIRALSAGHSL